MADAESSAISEMDPQVILANYKEMTAQCQTLASKIGELGQEREEHKLVIETLTKLEPERKAFRLVGGVLVERTVEEVLPAVTQNYEGVSGNAQLPPSRCYFIITHHSDRFILTFVSFVF
jgi:prefoldin subunit 2